MSSTDFATDGALGVSSVGLNPFVSPGVIYALALPTDISTNVVANIIASCEDSNATSPLNRYMIDDASGAANYYSYNGTSITKVKTGTATGTTYVAGKSDFISFNGFFYGSSPTVLNKWDGTSGAGLTEAFKTFGDASAHHPMLIYQRLMWVADGNTLSTLANDNTTYTTSVLSLDQKEKIVALGIDPATGLMMISVETVYDVSDTIPSLKAVYLYDGISTKPTRKILVDDLVTAFFNLEGIVYVGAGQTLGAWNGNGVTFLRKFQSVTLNNTSLAYKHHFANIRNILHVIDGPNVLSYGATISSKKGFFYTANAQSGSPNQNFLTCLFPAGSNRLGIAYSPTLNTTYKVYTFDFSSTSAGQAALYFNNIYFPRPIFVRRIRVLTTGVTTTSQFGIGNFYFLDERNHINQSTSTFIVAATATPKYTFDFDFTSAKVYSVQPRIGIDTQSYAIVRVIIYYDIAE